MANAKENKSEKGKKNLGAEDEIIVEEDVVVEESAPEPVVEEAPAKTKKAKKPVVSARNLDDLLPSQMTRKEMLMFCKDKGIELPPAASNVDIRKAIRIHLDNGRKVGPTL